MNTCLPKPDIVDFLQGNLDSERFDEISSHIDDCQNCQDTIVALSNKSNTFIDVLRKVEQVQQSQTPEIICAQKLEQLIAKGAKLTERTSSMVESSPALQISQVGPYRIEEQLGVGGMGTVFRATHTKLKRTVAIKILPAERWDNATAVSRFHREMEAIGNLDHPNIVRASDAGEHEGLHYLAMDFVDGLNLSQIMLRLKVIPIKDACRLIQQAAIGLHYAHENGLVHRDIKPSNIMLAKRPHAQPIVEESESSVKVLDLGLALLGNESLQYDNEVTTVGQLMGTLDYMAPEQGMDSHDVDHRADIYGLGATLFKLLTGQAPLSDPKYNTLMKKMAALATESAPSLAQFRNDVPDELIEVVDRMLSRDPEMRFESAQKVAEALEPFAAEADLASLIDRALKTEPMVDEFQPSLLPYHMRQPLEVTPSTMAVHKSPMGVFRWFVIVIVAVGMIASGIVIYIKTDTSQLVIKSDAKDVEIEIKKGEKVIAPSLKIDSKEKIIDLRTGDYQIRVLGDASHIALSKDEVTLQRGRPTELTIGVKDTSSEILSFDDSREAIDHDPNVRESQTSHETPLTYNGRTLQEWRKTFETERSLVKISEALEALAPSGTPNAFQLTVADCFQLLRRYDSRATTPNSYESSQLAMRSLEILANAPADQLVDGMLNEIKTGNDRSKDAVTRLLFNEISQQNQRYYSRLKRQMVEKSSAFIDVTLALSPDDENGVVLLHGILDYVEPTAEERNRIIERFRHGLKSEDSRVAYSAANFLVKHAPDSEGLIGVLGKLAKTNPDPSGAGRRYFDRIEPIKWLRRFGPKAAPVVPDLIESFGIQNQHYLGGEKLERAILETMKSMGQAGNSAVPFLKELVLNNSFYANSAIETLIAIDPDEAQAFVAPQEKSKPETTKKTMPNPNELKIARRAVKLAEAGVATAIAQLEAGASDGFTHLQASLHLLKAKFRVAELTDDKDQQISLRREMVQIGEQNVSLAKSQYDAGELDYSKLLSAERDLVELQLALERIAPSNK